MPCSFPEMTRDALLLLLVVIGSFAGLLVGIIASLRARTPPGRRRARAGAAVSGVMFVIFAWGRLIEPAWVVVSERRLAWPGPPLRITVLGDFHAGRVGAAVIARAVRLANRTDPDVVLLVGDYVTGFDLTSSKAQILEALRPLHARRGVFAVLGNHDTEPYRSRTPRALAITQLLEGMGFTVLRNRSVELAPGVALIGLGDDQAGDVDAVRAFLGAPGGARVVLTHDWHALLRHGVDRFDLAVTGHTHGGQVCVPLTTWCPLTDNDEPYMDGLYSWPRGGALFVTRGIGESAVLLRIGRRPEVAVLEMSPP